MIFSGVQLVAYQNGGELGLQSSYYEVLIVRVHPEILSSQGLPKESVEKKTFGKIGIILLWV